MFKNRSLLSFMLLSACMLFAAGTISAATFTVTNTTDCSTTNCGSLRRAIIDANAAAGADTIDATGVTGTITLTSNQLNILDTLTINGPGANQLTVSGNNVSRIFAVEIGKTATISGLTIANGFSASSGGGGGIVNFGTGTLTLVDCTVSGNTSSGTGGGIASFGTLTIINSTISDNNVIGTGGGIWTANGTLTVTNSTISGNSAIQGGGIYQVTGPGVTNISNSTIVNNSASGGGGGLFINGTANVKNTIIANQQSGSNCHLVAGTFGTLGVNYDNDGTCSFFTHVTLAQLDLGALTLNAPGTTATHALGTGSVAINAVLTCTAIGGNPVTTDQRGVTRPQGAACDAGSYEVEETPAGTALTALGPANMWIGLKNSDDVGIRFDLKAEAYRGTDLVGSGELLSVAGGSSGFNNAKLNSIPMAPLPGMLFVPGDQLSIRVLVKNSCTASGKNSGSARLWFNDAAANSRFDATIGTISTYYLRAGSVLSTTPGGGPKTTIDAAAGAKCSSYKPFGNWSITLAP